MPDTGGHWTKLCFFKTLRFSLFKGCFNRSFFLFSFSLSPVLACISDPRHGKWAVHLHLTICYKCCKRNKTIFSPQFTYVVSFYSLSGKKHNCFKYTQSILMRLYYSHVLGVFIELAFSNVLSLSFFVLTMPKPHEK